MSPHRFVKAAVKGIAKAIARALLRPICLLIVCSLAAAAGASAQELPPPAYLASVDGDASIVRDGEVQPAVVNMPFVTGDRLRTGAGKVEIAFPDGSAVEVGEYSEVEAM